MFIKQSDMERIIVCSALCLCPSIQTLVTVERDRPDQNQESKCNMGVTSKQLTAFVLNSSI